MASEIAVTEQVSNDQHPVEQIQTDSNTLNQHQQSHVAYELLDAFEITENKKKSCSCMKTSKLFTLIFALYMILASIFATLIICFTSPNKIIICERIFKQTMKSSIIHSSAPRYVAADDLNNDKNLDMVVVHFGTDSIGIFLSNDNQTMSKQQIYSTGSNSRPSSLIINDFNNDHYLDIVVANSGTNNIGLFIGFNNGTFDNNQMIFSTASFRPWFIAASDFNHDNQSDLAATSYNTHHIAIIISNKNGSFQRPIVYSTGYDSQPSSLVIADFDHDQQLDIAVANYGTDNIYIFMGYSNGIFLHEQIYPLNHNSNPSSLVLGDLNHDQQLDIIVANHGTGTLAIFLAHYNRTFDKPVYYLINSACRPECINVGYFDRNDLLDIVVIDGENDQIHILLDYTNETFSKLTTYDTVHGSYPIMTAVTDFNHDNQSDLVVTNYGTHNLIVLTEYFITPSARQVSYFIGTDSRPSSVVIYDFNNDSYLDLAVDNFNNDYIVIYNGDNSGTFTRGKEYSTGIHSTPQYQCIADLNNDNYMDIIIANLGSDSVGILFGQKNGSFSNATTYSQGTGSTPWYVAVDNLNNDTYLDIVSANYGTDTVGVLIGYGNGSFADLVLYPTGLGSNPTAIIIGDVNNDHHSDIVTVLCSTFNIAVFLGNSTGIFGTFATYSTGKFSYPFGIVLADFNRDNYLDIAVANSYTSNIGIFIGISDGTFMKQVTYSTGFQTQPYYVAVADFNNDHYHDIAAVNTATNEVVIFFGDGNGHFELARTYSTGAGSSPYGIAITDLNNDEQLEIVVTYWGTGYVAVLTQYDAADFRSQLIYGTGSAPHPYSLSIADLNHDNQSDVVVANSGTDDLSIYLTLNNGSYNAPITYPIGIDAYPQYVITGDINKDTFIDIVTVNAKNNTISIIMANRNGSFEKQMIYSTGDDSHPYAIAMNDFNNDNRYDFVVANEGTDSISIMFGFTYRSFYNLQTYSDNSNQLPNDVVIADFNNDNYLDIAATFLLTDNFAVLLGYGNGSFSMMISTSTGIDSAPYVLAANDFNDDNLLDIVVVNYGTSTIGIFLGYGNGSFAPMISYSTEVGSTPRYLAVADLNNDNQNDIVTVNTGTKSIGIFFGYDNGYFSTMITYSTGDYSYPHACAISDISHDDQLDIVVVNYGTSTIGVFLGYGNGSFDTQVIYSTGYQSWPISIVISDFNNDHHSDIAVSNYNANNVGVLLGYGNGSFVGVVTYPTGDGTTPQQITIGDFNNDNITDIAVANYATDAIVILFGFGDGTFLLGTEYSSGIGSLPISLAIADFNNDTRLDIVVANSGSSTIGILFGYGYEPFAGVIIYNTGDGSQPHSVAVADLNNDGWMDVIVTNYGTDNIGIFFGYGTKGLDSMIIYSTGNNSSPYSLTIGYFNNDTYPDIVVTNFQANDIIIFFGFSNGTFVIGGKYSTGSASAPSAVSVGDLNNDHILDIVIANYGINSILIFYGYGNGTFGNQTLYQLGYEYRPYSLGITNLNNDDRMDIIISCYNTDRIESLVMMC